MSNSTCHSMVGSILQQTYSRALCLYNLLHSHLRCPGMQTDESRIISAFKFSLMLVFIRNIANSAWNLAFFQKIWNTNTALLKCISFSISRREPPSLHFLFLSHHTTRFVFPFHLALKSLLFDASWMHDAPPWGSSNWFRPDFPPEVPCVSV